MSSSFGPTPNEALAPFEEQIRRAQKMEMVSNLAAGVAHHFNNLLMGILGASRMAARQLDEGHPALPYLAEIAAASDRGAELTRKLVAFGRARQPQFRPLRVGEVAESARDVLRDLLGEDVRLELALESPDTRVFADPEQLEQILVNLSVNARDAMPNGGTVVLGARAVRLDEGTPRLLPHMKPGDYVELSVRDTGRGMDPETCARAFEPFFTTKREGTGLGLYIVYGIVQSLGGRVEVESELERGTLFRILLPIYAAPSASGAGERKPRILVVEDERLIRITLRHTLSGHGFEVMVAGEAAEARSLHEAMGGFDLLLTDMILPGASGAELARELSTRQPGLPVLFMSAYPRELLIQQGRVRPDQLTLEKPFTEEGLLEVVRAALGHGAARS